MVVGHPGHLGERLACNGRVDDDKLPHKSLVVGGSITGLQVGRLYEKLAQEHHGEDYSNDAQWIGDGASQGSTAARQVGISQRLLGGSEGWRIGGCTTQYSHHVRHADGQHEAEQERHCRAKQY